MFETSARICSITLLGSGGLSTPIACTWVGNMFRELCLCVRAECESIHAYFLLIQTNQQVLYSQQITLDCAASVLPANLTGDTKYIAQAIDAVMSQSCTPFTHIAWNHASNALVTTTSHPYVLQMQHLAQPNRHLPDTRQDGIPLTLVLVAELLAIPPLLLPCPHSHLSNSKDDEEHGTQTPIHQRDANPRNRLKHVVGARNQSEPQAVRNAAISRTRPA
jgi:hypothetical protein